VVSISALALQRHQSDWRCFNFRHAALPICFGGHFYQPGRVVLTGDSRQADNALTPAWFHRCRPRTIREEEADSATQALRNVPQLLGINSTTAKLN